MRKFAGLLRSVAERCRAAFCSSFGRVLDDVIDPEPDASGIALPRQPHWLGGVCRLYLAHRFDLLGSGWAHYGYGAPAVGMLGVQLGSDEAVAGLAFNRANRREARAIAALLDAGYDPVDWHRDIKSGFRWRENSWFGDIRYGHLAGVDVKLPWELARMQHLPQLALAVCYGRESGVEGLSEQAVLAEFRNQILDFIARNPPQRGVNWACTMDVAIRVCNWLVAYQILGDAGRRLDQSFRREFSRSVRAHALHIARHLEWSEEVRDNHYLAGVVGLLFASSQLPPDRETNGWLAFSVAELIQAVAEQFNPDGSNFEASTSYHRLAAEMVFYATARVLGLPAARLDAVAHCDPGAAACNVRSRAGPIGLFGAPGFKHPFPPAYCQRVALMPAFTRALIKPDGLVPQLGDNDGGRFLRVDPVLRLCQAEQLRQRYDNLRAANDLPAAFWYEEDLDHRGLLAAGDALLRGEVNGLDGWLINRLSRSRRLPVESAMAYAGEACAGDAAVLARHLPRGSINTTHFSLPRGLQTAQLRRHAFPDFGVYVFSCDRFYLAVRCGAIGKNGRGGHAHNDQLAIELQLEGRDVVRDPGTYTYTASGTERNRYRSAFSHFVPTIAGGEPSSLTLGLFILGGDPRAEALYFGEAGFLGRHRAYGVEVWRKIRFDGGWLVVEDWCVGQVLDPPALPAVPYSPKYGWREGGTP